MTRSGNLFAEIPEDLAGELSELLLQFAGGRVERIVSRGRASPDGFWYDQDVDELVVVVSGAGELEIAGRPDPVRLEPGDWIVLPAHVRHRVSWTTPAEDTIWLAVFVEGNESG